MPEAPVDEDRDACFSERDVWPSWQGAVEPVPSKADSSECLTQQKLRPGVRLPDASHYRRGHRRVAHRLDSLACARLPGKR